MIAKFYAGIGSRQTPKEVLDVMTRIAVNLSANGWTLRSGASQGADQAFEKGATRGEIYLPWNGFNGRLSEPKAGFTIYPKPSPEAYNYAMKHHPSWWSLSQGAKSLHARNVHQILGDDLIDPSSFVICWTPDGATRETTTETGGTGQAIRIAVANNITVWNLAKPEHLIYWTEKL